MWCVVQSRYQKTSRCGMLFNQDIRKLADVVCCSVKISEKLADVVLFNQDIRRCGVLFNQDIRRCGVLFNQDIRKLADVGCCSIKMSED